MQMQNINGLGSKSGFLFGNIGIENTYINVTNSGNFFNSVRNINIHNLSNRTSVFMRDRMSNEIRRVFKFAKKAVFFAYCHPIIALSSAAAFYVITRPCIRNFLIETASNIISFCALYLMKLKLACDIKDCIISSVAFFVLKCLQYVIDYDANIDVKIAGNSDSLFFKILTAVGDVYRFLSSESKTGIVLASTVNKLCETVVNEVENAFVLCVERCIIDLVIIFLIKFMPTIMKFCISCLPFLARNDNGEVSKPNVTLEKAEKDSATVIKPKVTSESMMMAVK